MTNNPTIDGVSRDTIRRALSAVMSNNTSHWSSVLADELRALLDAPAVERQEPVTLAGLLEKNTIVVKVDVYDEQQATIARLEARITELESGRGEPAGEAGSMPGTSGFTMAAFKAEDVPIGTKLFTAPPAAASVILPERADASTGSHDAQHGWNACLDATAALNGPAK